MTYYGDKNLLESIIGMTGYAFAGFAASTQNVQSAAVGPDLQMHWDVTTGDISVTGPPQSKSRFMRVLREVLQDKMLQRKNPIQRFKRAFEEAP